MKKKLLLLAAVSLFASAAFAAEFTVRGTGTAPITKGADPQSIRTRATIAAKRKAVIAGIDKMLGAGASANEAVAPKIDDVVEQISDDTIADTSSQTVGDKFEVSMTLALDDRAFRELLSDAGIALNTSTARSYSILAVMDEYRTTPRDLNQPLEELTEFTSSKGASFSDQSSAGESSRSSSARASKSASTIDARSAQSSSASGQYAGSVSGKQNFKASGSSSGSVAAAAANRNGSASIAGSQSGKFAASGSSSVNASASGKFANQQASAASLKGSSSSSSAAASSSSSSAYVKADVNAEVHDDVTYRKLVKYQPKSTAPEANNLTYTALLGQLQGYDLRVLDNDVFRSKYFQNNPLTLEKLNNGGELARYVSYAKTDARADFFMIGTSIIIDGGVSPSTGQTVCNGIVSMKAYSTVDGEVIASFPSGANGSGVNSDDCASDVAQKLANAVGPVLGAQVQTYWKRRSMYGRELVLTLSGPFLSLPVKVKFAKALAALPGVETSVQRSSGATEVEMTVSYKGSEPIDQALAMVLMEDAIFANLDSRTDGQRVVMCLGPCKPGI